MFALGLLIKRQLVRVDCEHFFAGSKISGFLVSSHALELSELRLIYCEKPGLIKCSHTFLRIAIAYNHVRWAKFCLKSPRYEKLDDYARFNPDFSSRFRNLDRASRADWLVGRRGIAALMGETTVRKGPEHLSSDERVTQG